MYPFNYERYYFLIKICKYNFFFIIGYKITINIYKYIINIKYLNNYSVKYLIQIEYFFKLMVN